MNRKRLIFLAKLAVSSAIIALIYLKVLRQDGSDEMLARLSQISWKWVALAAAADLCAICISVVRWDRLLVGQDIQLPWRFLFNSFWIGRFFGAVSPGGWIGLNGFRLYDVAVKTGQTARSAAAIGVEMVLGYLSFAVVLIFGTFFGAEVIGVWAVVLIDLAFIALIAVSIVLLARPRLFRKLGALLPARFAPKLESTIAAVCAYEGKTGLLAVTAVLGMGTHTMKKLIYLCTAQALGAELGFGQLFFVAAMQSFATLLPISVSGIGVREATAVALYTRMGVPTSVAFLIPVVGFAVEMTIASFGGLAFLARSVKPGGAPPEAWPRVARGAVVGFAGGLLGGVLLGVGEALVVLASGSGNKDYSVLAYGGAIYGLACAAAGLGLGVVLALSGRWLKRAALPEPVAYGRIAALLASGGAFAIGAFRVRRDVYAEMLAWASPKGLLVIFECLLAAGAAYLLVSTLARLIVARRPFNVLLRPWSSPLVLGIGVLVAAVGPRAEAAPGLNVPQGRKPAPAAAGNVLFIVIDTLRADHLPLWGHAAGHTPNLDAFAKDAVRFDQAFANASWTRPSFASLMTGRYPGSHKTMLKSDSLPDEIVTLAEAMQGAGYTTWGVVTNYNVAPFFNFHQGFDEYRYLEPDFVLGANDTAAKLLFVQLVRQKYETVRAKLGKVEPGSAYQDAEQVNAEILRFLDRKPKAPLHLFAAYMDPHDPYYPHPYDGTGYSRAAHQKPDPSDVELMRKLYDGEITFWDAHFGKLVAELKRRGLYDDLTLVITADHGEEFLDHGGFWHGTTLYDEQIRVPLLLKLPRSERGGSVVQHWVESIDIMPTLLRRNGIALPEGVQGKDLFEPSGSVYAEEDHEGNVLRALRMRRGQSELKLIEANPGNPRGLQPYEMFRMDQDRGELVNLARDDADTLGVAVTNLEQRAEQSAVGAAARQQLDMSADPAAMQKLRALGYAGDAK